MLQTNSGGGKSGDERCESFIFLRDLLSVISVSCSIDSILLLFGVKFRVVRAMEEEMEMEVEVFQVLEIDLDYEFEAARFFDFTREETEEEVCEAEFWFETAKSYPPSRKLQLSIKSR